MTRVDLALLEDLYDFKVSSIAAVAGGDINLANKLQTNNGTFFLKTNSTRDAEAMFIAERDGINYLAQSGLATPKVIGTGKLSSKTAYLLLEFMDTVPGDQLNGARAGRALANAHRNRADIHGFPRDNYIGTIEQVNTQTVSWSEFYITRRLEPLIVRTGDLLSRKYSGQWDKIKANLEPLLTCEHPSPLHGDLWGGNMIYSSSGPVFIDPAVYNGDRIVDLAMTRLFGGFPVSFYAAYHEAYPVEPDELEIKIPMYQLYYLLVHVALFGRSYVASVERILERFL